MNRLQPKVDKTQSSPVKLNQTCFHSIDNGQLTIDNYQLSIVNSPQTYHINISRYIDFKFATGARQS